MNEEPVKLEGPRAPRGLRPKEPRPTAKNLIQSLMKERRVRGNYKDYVIIHAGSMMDHEGMYQLTVAETGAKVKIEAIQLFHKRELISFMRPEVAKLFWDPRVGMRVSKRARGDRLPRVEVTGDRSTEATSSEQTTV